MILHIKNTVQSHILVLSSKTKPSKSYSAISATFTKHGQRIYLHETSL